MSNPSCIKEPDGGVGISQVTPTVASTNLYTSLSEARQCDIARVPRLGVGQPSTDCALGFTQKETDLPII